MDISLLEYNVKSYKEDVSFLEFQITLFVFTFIIEMSKRIIPFGTIEQHEK